MNNTIKSITIGFMAIAIALAPVSVFAAPAKNIVETAIDTPALSTLVKLVVKAGLDDDLQTDGPFTVFAPTDDAFANLPPIVNKALAKDPGLLNKILLYHVVSGDIESSEVSRFVRLDTLSGRDVFARNIKGNILINQSRVIIPDVKTSNGTVHVIDRVLIPWLEVAKSLVK